jgi:4,5-dihydroxyphthalate decarboxylase
VLKESRRRAVEAGAPATPFGVAACRPALEKIIEYAAQQQLIPRRFEVDELFDDTTRKMS